MRTIHAALYSLWRMVNWRAIMDIVNWAMAKSRTE